MLFSLGDLVSQVLGERLAEENSGVSGRCSCIPVPGQISTFAERSLKSTTYALNVLIIDKVGVAAGHRDALLVDRGAEANNRAGHVIELDNVLVLGGTQPSSGRASPA